MPQIRSVEPLDRGLFNRTLRRTTCKSVIQWCGWYGRFTKLKSRAWKDLKERQEQFECWTDVCKLGKDHHLPFIGILTIITWFFCKQLGSCWTSLVARSKTTVQHMTNTCCIILLQFESVHQANSIDYWKKLRPFTNLLHDKWAINQINMTPH